MKLLVGLGNPGPRYVATRHNVGFRIVEHFADSRGIAIDAQRYGARFGRGALAIPDGGALDVAILEPQGYMNRSGEPVAAAVGDLGIQDPADVLVAFDDLDLGFGRLRLRPRGSAGGHRGLADIIDWLECSDFPRLRFGVGRPPDLQETVDYVLEPFAAEEERTLRGRLAAAADALEMALVEGLAPAMNRFNRDPAPPAEKEVPDPSDFSPTEG
jgi:PTH1 family peptidyl-tRNA hydrolase